MFSINKTLKFPTSDKKQGITVRGSGTLFWGCFGSCKTGVCELEAPVRLAAPGNAEIEKMGAFSYFCADAYLNGVSEIGRFTSVSTNVQMGLPQHPTNLITTSGILMNTKPDYWCAEFTDLYKDKEWGQKISRYYKETEGKKRSRKIKIGSDVWIGANAVIQQGVEVGHGAIVANNAVVTKDVPPYAIVAGIPAKIIRMRFPEDIVQRLLKVKWWQYGTEILKGIPAEISEAVKYLEERKEKYSLYRPEKFIFELKEQKIYRENVNGQKKIIHDFNKGQ